VLVATRIRAALAMCTLHATDPAETCEVVSIGPDNDGNNPGFVIFAPVLVSFANGGVGLNKSGGAPAGRGGGARSVRPDRRPDLFETFVPRSNAIADADRERFRLVCSPNKLVAFRTFEED